MQSRCERLLVLHGGALGDCVLALHLAAAAKAALSANSLTFAARSPIVRWAAKRGFINDAKLLDEVAAHRWHTSHHPADPFLNQFDVVISFLGGADEPITTNLSRAGARSLIALDARPSAAARTHITQQWANELARHIVGLELNEHGSFPALGTRSGPEGDTLAIVHPGSGGKNKCCPLEALEALVRRLGDAGRVVWMIGPDELERDGPALRSRLGTSAPVAYKESIEDAAEFVAAARYFVGNDAGMTHVAALAGVNTIAIFGPTDPLLWRPIGPRCRIAGFPGADVSDWLESLGLPIPPMRRALPA